MKNFYLISIIILQLLSSCEKPTIIGTWVLDKTVLKKDNPEISSFTLDAASTAFYLLEFKKNNTVISPLLNIENTWEKNSKNEIIIHSDEENSTVHLLDNNLLEIYSTNIQNGKKYKFHFTKIIKNSKVVPIKESHIYQSKLPDNNGWYHYMLFSKGHYSHISVLKNSNKITLELFNKKNINLEGSWERESGNYIIINNIIYTISAWGPDKMEIISKKEIKFNTNILTLKQ